MNTRSLLFTVLLIVLSLYYCLEVQAEPPPPPQNKPATMSGNTAPTVTSLTPEYIAEREQRLAEEQAALAKKRDAIAIQSTQLAETIATLQPEDVNDEILQQASFDKQAAQLALDKARVEAQNLSTAIKEQKNTLQERQQRLESLKTTQAGSETDIALLAQRIEQQQISINLLTQALQIEEKRLVSANELVNLLERELELMKRWENTVFDTKQLQKKQALETQIQEERQTYFEQATRLRQELAALPETANLSKKQLLQTQIQVAEYRAQLVADQLKVNFVQDALKRLDYLVKEKSERIELGHQKELEQLQQDLTELTLALSNRLAVLQQQLLVHQQRKDLSTIQQADLKKEQTELNSLIEELKSDLNIVTQTFLSVIELEKPLTIAYSVNLRNRLMQRRQLPENSLEWQELLTDISLIPNIIWQQSYFTTRSFISAFQQIDAQRWLIICSVVLVWLVLVLYARQHLTRVFNHLNEAAEISSSARSLLTFLHLLDINKVGIAATGVLLLMIWLAQPPYPGVLLSLVIACFWLSLKFPIDLAYLILLDKDKLAELTPEETAERVKLYRQLRWMVLFAGSLVIVTLLAHILPLAPLVKDLIDTGFMLILSITILPVMRIRSLLIKSLKEKIRGYWMLVIRLTTLIVPFAILTVAIMGVIGFLNLGWYVAWRLGLFLFVFISWLILRGVLEDLINLLKNFALRHSEYGLLWTQDIIPLFDKLLGIALVGAAIFVLFWLNGWFNDDLFMASLKAFFDYTVFVINETPISIGNILLAIFTFWSVFWFSGWIKRVTYRWIYSRITDLGARSSLSTFTQYIVLVIGLLITLKVIGINLTTLMVLLGGLGVGIGFGLQNIVNNFVSGILLLIERPLRTGDIVNVGGNEGFVTKIGMRSLTISTWNKQDVIVPNSDVITNSFINWTHSDKVLRITLYVGASYSDDPHQVKQIIAGVLEKVEGILKEPAPSVILWEFAESSINFRVDYYFHLINSSGFITRDAILFAIWDAFKAANITIPFPQRDLHVRAIPRSEIKMVTRDTAAFDEMAQPIGLDQALTENANGKGQRSE